MYNNGDLIELTDKFVIPELAGTQGIVHAVGSDYCTVQFVDTTAPFIDPEALYHVGLAALRLVTGNHPDWEV